MNFLQGRWPVKNIIVLLILLFIVAGFELYPAVHFHRIVVPEEIYVGQACDCQCILDARPWYSRFNYWFWLFVFSVPVLSFSVKPNATAWQRGLRTLVTIALGYWFVNLAMNLGHEIRNGPFMVYSDVPFQKTMNMLHCNGGSGGGARSFTTLFGWIFAFLYAGWWEMLWYVYHQRKTHLIDAVFRHDFLSKIAIVFSVLVPVLFALWLLAMAFFYESP